MLVKNILISLFWIFQFVNSYAQPYFNSIDSIIGSLHLNEKDWVIELEVDRGGYIASYDSLGNMLSEDPNGIYIISKINDQCSFYKLNRYNSIPANWKVKSELNISDSNICSYTSDSIKKTQEEWIYPNIYRNDSSNTYNMQMNSAHSSSFRFCFKTKESMEFKYFTEVDVYFSPVMAKHLPKNLNYDHNSSTFIYRVLMNINQSLKKGIRLELLQ